MSNISGFGLKVQIKASVTYPLGLTITQFSDDADPMDIPSNQIGDVGMGLNGDLVGWSKATPNTLTLSIIPDSEDDNDLDILAKANSVGKGKTSVRDKIDAVIIYPNGKLVNFNKGMLTDAMLANAISSAGRIKTKVYVFKFESVR